MPEYVPEISALPFINNFPLFVIVPEEDKISLKAIILDLEDEVYIKSSKNTIIF